MFWNDIFYEYNKRIDVVLDGILRDTKMNFEQGQQSECEMRESVAKPFIGEPEQSVREATRHHSYGVMRRQAYKTLKSLSSHQREKGYLLVDLGCGFGWHWADLAKEFPLIRFLLIDFSMANLLVSRSLMPFNDYPNVLCLQSDIVDIPIQHHSSDFCWSVQMLQHLQPVKRIAAFREILRIQKSGAGFYIAWLRSVPFLKFIYSILGKDYHLKGDIKGGRMFLQRFDEEIESEMKNIFTNYYLEYSETLFHPELKLIPYNSWIGYADIILGKTFIAQLFARQVEILGRC